MTYERYSKLLKIFTNAIKIDPQVLLNTNFKDVTQLKNLLAKTANLKQNKTKLLKALVNLKKSLLFKFASVFFTGFY